MLPVFIDACVLAGVRRRDLLLSLAVAGLFRVHWSMPVLEETERAITKILTEKGVTDAVHRAARARAGMEKPFPDAMVRDFDDLLSRCADWPDPGDAHVVAAALKAGATIIVTENLKDFPQERLAPFAIKAQSADAFLAETITHAPGKAIPALRQMRERLKKPEKTPDQLLLILAAAGLSKTVDTLRPYLHSL